jgi:hypothetical protein
MLEQDEADTDSEDAPDLESIFDVCREATKSKRRNSSMLSICVPKVFHLPSTRGIYITAVFIHVLLGLCLWQLNGTTQHFR